MEFHITCDFRDDFTASEARWTKDRFREFIRIIADLGMKAIHWIEIGDREMGKWDPGSSTDLHGNAQAFIDEIPDPLAFLCEEAHGLGMKVFAVHKINDMASFGPGRFYPLGDAPSKMPGIPQIGGSGQMAFRWLRDHPDKRVEIHPSLMDSTDGKPLKTIRIWHESEGLVEAPKIEIFVSETNGSYVRYGGEMRVDVSVRTRRPPVFAPAPDRRFADEGRFTCIEISGLQVSEPFIAVCFNEQFELTNTITALVEMEDSNGDPVTFTCGFSARSDYSRSLGSFRDAGIAFDANWELPLEDYPGWIMWEHSAGRYRINLGRVPFLGLARGRNQYLSSPVELSYPEVREWLLGTAEYELNAGCDGVDIRVECHTQNMDFENYGFGTPIIEAFRERHGVDITREPFDRGAWRVLRGEYFERFLEEVSELILSRGKERWIHLTGYPTMNQPPNEPSLYQMFWNWEKWLTEGLVDVVNFKRFRSRSIPARVQEKIDVFYEKAVGLCRRLDLPMAFTPDPIKAVVAEEDFVGREFVDIDRAFADGFQVYNIYETATYIHLTDDGFVVDEDELWRKIARR